MAAFKHSYTVDLKERPRVAYLGSVMWEGDACADVIELTVLDHGNPADLSGTVTAEIIRPDQTTTTSGSGTISGNVCTVTLPAAAYAVTGAIKISVKIAIGSTITTIWGAVATVAETTTDVIIDPGTIIPSITALMTQIDNAVDSVNDAIASIPADYSALLGSVSEAYDNSKTYNIGQYVWYDGQLYQCKTAITTAEEWTAAHWTKVALAESLHAEVSDLKSALSELEDVVGEPNYSISSRLPLETMDGYYTIVGAYVANNSYLATKLSVTAGEMYAVSTAVQSSLNFALAVFLDADDGLVGYYKRSDATEIVVYADEIVKVPEGAVYMCITTLKASMNPMMVKNATLISISEIATDTQENFEGIFEHKNLINPDDIAIDIRYASSGKLVYDITNYAGTGMIPVEEGEMYTFSGTAMQALGGYYGEGAHMVVNETAIASVTFFDPVTGSGKVFTVPENQNIKYVTLVLKKANGEIDGTYQLEKGEMATEIVPYSDVTIRKSLLPAASVQPAADIDSLPVPQYDSNLIKSMQKFRDHWAKKDKDIVVVGTGTSLTARGAEHCTSRGDAASRPPLMDSNNFASAMWDKMRWEGQQYRRYDYTGFFTETGTFLTSRNLSDWDDANYHDAWTRYSNSACSVAYTIPADAWQVNFIYRTDQSGSEAVTVSVAEGNGIMQVWNGTEWVEANGYTFSMRETPVILPSVSVPNPRGNEDNSNFTLTNYQISGNTTYQKRLKMRAVTRTATKTITIASTTGRFMYWGVEWSVREFMITYINSARGSHNMTVDSGNALQKTQDNEIWSHKPDLIFCENPIHNSGGSGSANGFSSYYSTYWRNVTYDFFFNTETNPVSLMSRAIACGIDVTELEWCIFNSSISWNFGGIDNDGLLKIQPDRNGRMITALDAQMMSQDYLTETEKCVSINACKYWVDAAFKMFGNLKAATIGSGKDGSTFTNEGSHWNDTGCAIMARCIGGVFDFYN